MPLSKHYSGHGSKVMIKMKKNYGTEKGKGVFYATANKQKHKGKVEKALRSAFSR